MARLRFAIVFVLSLTLATAYVRTMHGERAPVAAAAPVLQATAAPTPVAPAASPAGAPIGEGTQQVLTILGLVVAAGVLIGGGIYLRRRWIATRY